MAVLNGKQGTLVLILGPSGVGKSAIVKRLRATHSEWHFPRSATTRAQREGEGTDLYHFVTDEEFDQLLQTDRVLEWATIHDGGRYATLADEIIPPLEQGQTVVREVDVQGFDSIRKNHRFAGDHPSHRMASIFILPGSKEELIERIRKRAPMSDDELQRRLKSMEREMLYADLCSVKIPNPEGHLEETASQVELAIQRL